MQDGQLVLEEVVPRADPGKRQPVGLVLGLVPTGAETDLDSAAAHVIDLGRGDGERPDRAEGHRRHQGAEADRGGVACEAGERDPCVGRARQSARRAHLEVVVRAEERAEPALLRRARDGEQLIVRGALLGLGEDAKCHVRRL